MEGLMGLVDVQARIQGDVPDLIAPSRKLIKDVRVSGVSFVLSPL